MLRFTVNETAAHIHIEPQVEQEEKLQYWTAVMDYLRNNAHNPPLLNFIF